MAAKTSKKIPRISVRGLDGLGDSSPGFILILNQKSELNFSLLGML